jgi:hypothetical protein
MRWYGLTSNNNVILKKKNAINIRKKNSKFYFKPRFNLNSFRINFFFPAQWNILLLNFKKNLGVTTCYIYSSTYYFYLFYPNKFLFLNYDWNLNLLSFNFFYKNNYFNLYWNSFKLLFYSLNKFFFRKLKFKGKGYYIYKNIRNTVALQFGYSHKTYLYSFFLRIKFLTKTSVLVFGVNTKNISLFSHNFKNLRPINIFTNKGIRFSKQIIYKKVGKISSYR